MRKLLLLASAVVLVDTSFYAAITPLLPDLTEEFGLSKTRRRHARRGVSGRDVRRRPARRLHGGARRRASPTVLLGLALMTLASVAFAFAASIVVLDLARFVQGVGGAASWAGAMAWLAGAAPREKRGQMIGSAMGAAIAGALLGPVIGVAADLVGFELVFCIGRRRRRRADGLDAAHARAPRRSATARCAGCAARCATARSAPACC